MSDSGNIAAMQRELGRQLAALRREAGLTQESLAALAGFARTTLSMAEIGRQSQAREFWQVLQSPFHGECLGAACSVIAG